MSLDQEQKHGVGLTTHKPLQHEVTLLEDSEIPLTYGMTMLLLSIAV